MILVRRIRGRDGSGQSGKPSGPALKVLQSSEYKPVEGPGAGRIVILSDGTCEFEHNLVWICPHPMCLKGKRFIDTGPITLTQPSAQNGYHVCSCPASKLVAMMKS